MNQLTVLSDDADQVMFVPLDDGSTLQMEFIYRPGIQRWTVSITHPLLNLNSYTLCAFPNILRQWKNLIPFGMAVVPSDNQDPVDTEDFANGRITIYILNSSDVQQVETQILEHAA